MDIQAEVRSLVLRTKSLMDRDAWLDALEVAAQAERLAAEHDLDRSWIWWARAVCLDVTGRPTEALDCIDVALTFDGTSALAFGSETIIVDRLKTIVADPQRSPEERSAVYQKLAAKGHAGYADHLAHIDVLRVQGRAADALVFAMSIGTIYPTDEIKALIELLRPEVN